jgi:aspartyl-tRNA(Asn)/glutamyl-tRNA(Gln) amidotransferase subunit C
MALTLDEVRRIATLARLRLTPEEEARFVPQLSRIVEYIDQLRDYEVARPAAGEFVVPEAADIPAPSTATTFFLDNAPDTLETFLLVPQVKGGGDG